MEMISPRNFIDTIHRNVRLDKKKSFYVVVI